MGIFIDFIEIQTNDVVNGKIYKTLNDKQTIELSEVDGVKYANGKRILDIKNAENGLLIILDDVITS